MVHQCMSVSFSGLHMLDTTDLEEGQSHMSTIWLHFSTHMKAKNPARTTGLITRTNIIIDPYDAVSFIDQLHGQPGICGCNVDAEVCP